MTYILFMVVWQYNNAFEAKLTIEKISDFTVLKGKMVMCRESKDSVCLSKAIKLSGNEYEVLNLNTQYVITKESKTE